MPKRYKSQLYDEDEIPQKIYLDGFPNTRISSTICLYKHTNNEISSLELGKRSIKRRKISGLNDRLNRMLLRANTSFVASSDPPTFPHRKRIPSAGSSSTLSIDYPKTPLDNHSEGEQRPRLGESLSVIKLVQPKKLRKRSPSPVPSWLSDTLSTLELDHPLRMLAAPPAALDDAYSVPSNKLLDSNYHFDEKNIDADDNLFAYNAPLTPPINSRDLTRYTFVSSSRAESYCRASSESSPGAPVIEHTAVLSPGVISFEGPQFKHQNFLFDPPSPEAASLGQYDLDSQSFSRSSNNSIIDDDLCLGTPLNVHISRPRFPLNDPLDDGESTLLDAEANSPGINSSIHSGDEPKFAKRFISHYFIPSESNETPSNYSAVSPTRIAMHSPILSQPHFLSFSSPVEEPNKRDFVKTSYDHVGCPKSNFDTVNTLPTTIYDIDELETEGLTRNYVEQGSENMAELSSSDDDQSYNETIDGHSGYPRNYSYSTNLSCAYNKIAFTPSSEIYISPLRSVTAEDSDDDDDFEFELVPNRSSADNENDVYSEITEIDELERGKLTKENLL